MALRIAHWQARPIDASHDGECQRTGPIRLHLPTGIAATAMQCTCCTYRKYTHNIRWLHFQLAYF